MARVSCTARAGLPSTPTTTSTSWTRITTAFRSSDRSSLLHERTGVRSRDCIAWTGASNRLLERPARVRPQRLRQFVPLRRGPPMQPGCARPRT
jgi:hypothetical protein